MIIDKFKNLELYKHATSKDVNEEYKDWQYDLDTTNIVRLVAELEQLLIHSVVVPKGTLCKCGSEYYHTYKCVNTKCTNCIINK